MALLLALRWVDEHDAEQAAIAAFNCEEAHAILPPHLRWAAWREAPRLLTATEVDALWNGIRGALGLAPVPRGIHHEVRIPSGPLLGAMVDWIDHLPLDTPAGRSMAGEALTDLVVQAMSMSRFGGELVTPRSLGRLMVALADPQPGERIYDPCFGAGGLLVDAAEALWWRGRGIAPGAWAQAQRVPVFGVELNVAVHLVAFVRLLLAGVRPALEVGDALEREAAGRHHDQGFDCVLADPPLGLKPGGAHLYNFPIHGRTSENLFVQHAVRSLRPGGRAVVAVPPALLERGGPDSELRRWLLTEHRVDAVVHLASSPFRDLRVVPPALVLVRRAARAESVRILELADIPSDVQAIRELARVLLDPREPPSNRLHRCAVVSVIELLKADARLAVPATIEGPTADMLAALAERSQFRPLAEVVRITPGVPVQRRLVIERPEPEAIPLVRVGDVREGVLSTGVRFLLPEGRAKVTDAHWVHRGDVLVSVDGTIGKVLLVQHTLDAEPSRKDRTENGRIAVAQKGLVILRPQDLLDPRFLAVILASEAFQGQLRRLASATTISHLPLASLRELRIPVPPLEVQTRVLRRLADRPGDAVDALMAVLGGQEDDPLTRLFRESSTIARLSGEGIPEAEELYQLGLDAFTALRALRNQAAHDAIDAPPHARRWLLTVGTAPVVSGRHRGAAPDWESLDATRTMLDRALESARDLKGMLGRQATRLTERLLLWVDAAKTRAAGDFRIGVEHQFEDVSGSGVGRLRVTISLSGSAPLRDFAARMDQAGNAVQLPELMPGTSATLQVSLDAGLPWMQGEDGLLLPCRLLWSARRADGQPVEGAEPLILRRPLDRGQHGAETGAADLGVSPYITGDVVNEPEMFFGRKGVLDDIRTHIGGGTRVILLEGNRRTGKTSILRQLQRPEMGLLGAWIPVECSFQATVGDPTKEGISTEGVFRLLIREIGGACAKAGIFVPLPEMEATSDLKAFRFQFLGALTKYLSGIDPYEALQIYVDTVTEAIAPRRLLLMLDEFDKLQVGIDNGVTSPQVPENIRNLLQTRPALSLIIAGSRRLKRLREEYWSALFGFGHRIGIDPLAPAEVRDLIMLPVAGRLSFDDAAVGLIADLTARQPYLVQSLCARVFELAKGQGWRQIHREEVLEAVGRMVRDNEHFLALWSYAETERRRYLLWLCSRLADGPQRVNASLLNEHLDQAGIVVPVEHVDDDLKFLIELELVALVNPALGPQYELAVPLMRRWMELNVDPEAQRRKALHETQKGLQG